MAACFKKFCSWEDSNSHIFNPRTVGGEIRSVHVERDVEAQRQEDRQGLDGLGGPKQGKALTQEELRWVEGEAPHPSPSPP